MSFSAHAQTQETKLEFKHLFTGMPDSSKAALQMSFSKESLPWWASVTASSLILINNDEVILRDFQEMGRHLGLGNRDNTKAAISLGSLDIIRLPTDLGSMMYFLGDGWMHFGIAGGFVWSGSKNDDNRAFNTGMRIMHGMMVSTVFNQFLKRAFGRESPYVKSEYGGRWSPFPSIPEYQERTSKYDAMPSGHIMTATLTFTIINDAYPEYSHYIVPLEVTWLTLLGFQMVNNGVHWAGDYPLGIAMGYVFGKVSSQLGRSSENFDPNKTSWMVLPYQNKESSGLSLMVHF